MRNVTAWVALVGALAGASATASAQTADDSALQRAYRKEFAFLEAEKRALEQRLAEVRTSSEQKAAAGEREVQAIAGQVMGMGLQAETLMQQLTDAQRQSDVVAEGDDLIEATITQASSALEKGGLKLVAVEEGDTEARAKQLSSAFDSGIQLLERFGSVRETQGDYFGAKGAKLSGKIVHVGNVAAYGIGSESGALAPAGGGKLKVFQAPSNLDEKAAQALAEGKAPDAMGIFLYESLEKDFESRPEKTALSIIKAGGVIAWVIVALGVVAMLMLLVRAVILVRNSANSEKWVSQLAPLVRAGKYKEAGALCDKSNTAPARVLGVTVKNLDSSREQLDDLVSEQIMAESPLLDMFGQMVLVFAAIAPLLGLLGTVTGMISTFDIITEFGTGNPKLLSGGISEALITTELGLVVAIPALLGGNMLGAWGERIKTDMDRASLRLTNIAFGKGGKGADEDTSTGGEAALAPAE